MNTQQSYPLQWPNGRPRTKHRRRAPFHRRTSVSGEYGTYARNQSLTIADSRDRVLHEFKLMGISSTVISSNLRLRGDGLPASGQAEPDDPGVAVYFQIEKRPHCLSCDTWDRASDNLAAIAKHVEAMRGQIRWGVADLSQMFFGFKALPPPGPSDDSIPTVEEAAQLVSRWQNGVYVNPVQIVNDSEIWRRAYRTAAAKLHPDAGGDPRLWHLLQAAKTLLDAHHAAKGNA